jgi:hypothetical protein
VTTTSRPPYAQYFSDQEDMGDVSDHHFPAALNQPDGYAGEQDVEQQGQFIALQSGGAW